jgi:hypothetical protein
LTFLKKHYEKILLALFLIIFVIALFYQIDIIRGASEVTKKDLQLKEMTANYKAQAVDFNDNKFKISAIFMKGSSWAGSTARDKKDKYFTDLLIPFKMVRCPHCEKILPLWSLMNDPHECMFCHGELKRPARIKIKKTFVIKDDGNPDTDSDGGGVPDMTEKKYGLDPANPDDDTADMDGDGFGNSYEYLKKTKINDAKSHPPLYLRLYLKELVKNKLNFTLKNIILQGENKADWDIQINFGAKKTGFYWLDDMMKVDNREYKIISLDAKSVKIKDGNIEKIKTDGHIKIKSADGKEVVTAVIGKEVFSPNPRAIIIDEGTDRKYSMNIGDVIEIGTKKTGMSRYKVTDINSAKGEEAITIMDLADKKTYSFNKTLEMPPIKKERASNFGGAEGELMDGMPNEMPSSLDRDPINRRGSRPRSSARDLRRRGSRRRGSRRNIPNF